MGSTMQAFLKLNMIAATAMQVTPNKSARIPSYLLNLDVGPKLLKEHPKPFYKSSAQLAANYQPSDLEGVQLLTVANFPRKQIGSFMSDLLTTAVQDETPDPQIKRESNVIVVPSVPVPNGSVVSINGEEKVLESNPRDLSWGEFTNVNMLVGTVLKCEVSSKLDSSLVKYLCSVDIGREIQSSLILPADVDLNAILALKNQVLVLLLDEQSATEEGANSWILSVGGKALLHPERPVDNGYKLA